MCLLAAPSVQLAVSAGNGWPHNALRHHWLMPISCHFRDCTALLVTSLTHVSGAIASVQTFTFTFTNFLVKLCEVVLIVTVYCRTGEYGRCSPRLRRCLCCRVPTADVSHVVLRLLLNSCHLVRRSNRLFNVCQWRQSCMKLSRPCSHYQIFLPSVITCIFVRRIFLSGNCGLLCDISHCFFALYSL